jgi:Flp pilus assembly protein CpaB
MRGGRVLILIGALILLAVVVVVVLMSSSGGGETEATPEGGAVEPGETPPPGDGGAAPVDTSPFVPQEQNMVEIVVAIQDLTRGLIIPEDGVGTQLWPEQSLPPAGTYFLVDLSSATTEEEAEKARSLAKQEVIGMIARTDIARGAPIMTSQVVDNLYEIAAEGSDAAAILLAAGQNLVAVSIPLDPSGIGQVAYGIQDGDYVDVILSFLYVDVDPTFQTRLPNNYSIITRMETGELSIGIPRQGRVEASTLSPEGVLLGPSEASQRPRLVTQRTVPDAFVVHVGYFPEDGRFIGGTPTPQEVPTLPPPPGEGTGAEGATPVPSPTSYAPLIITLGVTPQQALVLTWAVDAQIPITLALRQAGDRSVTVTEPVTLDYMIRNYNAAPPNALEFSLEPPITSVRRFDIGTLYDFLGETVTGE